MKKAIHHPVYRFLLFFALLSLGWYFIYDIWLHPTEAIDEPVIQLTIHLTEMLLELSGYNVFTYGLRNIGIEGTSGLFIGDNCNAITLMALFSGFIIAFPGHIKNKLWFIPAGCLFLFFMNVIRIYLLAVIEVYSYSWMQFNHTYTFTIIVYLFIFILWVLWVKYYSGVLAVKNNEKAV